MDREIGKQRSCSSGWRILLVLTLSVALLSLVLSTLVFANALYGGRLLQRKAITIEEGRMLSEVASHLEVHRQNKRSSSPCTSEYDPCVVPSAHITSVDRLTDVWEAASDSGNHRYKQVLSTGWYCYDFLKGHVKGGMTYDEEMGFLQIPVDGIYFVYSQVLMQMDWGDPVQYGHSTVTCSCNAECSCDVIASVEGRHQWSYVMGQEYLSTSFSHGSTGGTNYHGGLFHFVENSYVAVVANYQDIIHVSGSSKAFMGAYLVSPDAPATCNSTTQ